MNRLTKTNKSTRRGNKEGTIYQRKDGKWCCQILVGYDKDGKPKRKTHYGATRTDVSTWLALTLGDMYGGKLDIGSDDITLRGFATEWLSRFKRFEIGTKTLEGYWSCLNLHILPELGDDMLGGVTTTHLQRFLYGLQADKDLGIRSITMVRSTLIQIFDHALGMRMVESNPARGTKLPKQRKCADASESKAISIALREKIMLALSDEPVMRPIITTLMFTGMRIGEALGLEWRHVNFEKKMITIEQSAVQELTIDKSGKTVRRDTTLGGVKTTASQRTIRVADVVIDSLKQWQVHQCLQKNAPAAIEPESVVFCNTRTHNLRTYSGFRASYRHFLRRHDLDEHGLNLHRYRHTVATMLLELGVNPKIVQNLLGHSDISTTLGVYSHVVSEVYDGVAVRLNTAFEDLQAGNYRPQIGGGQIKKLADGVAGTLLESV
jgi:integrase